MNLPKLSTLLLSTTVCIHAAAWNISSGPDTGTMLDFSDLISGRQGPFTIEKASGKWSPYSVAGRSDNGIFSDNATSDPTSAYYRILDASGLAIDTLSFDRQLFGDKILLFSPTDNMDSVASRLSDIDHRLFGREMSADRYALLFKPGDYKGAGLINVPFYVHIAGLGATPYEVEIDNIHTPPHLRDGNGTCTFWRSAENLAVIGPETYDEPETFKWAVSQAAPMRRIVSQRTLRTQWGDGWVSGGYAADCLFEAPAGSDHQQQWYYRNSMLNNGRGDFREEKYNYCFQGVEFGPEADMSTYRNNWDEGGNVTIIDSTPVIAEKPFLCIGPDGRYKVFRPAFRRDAKGVSFSPGNPGEGEYLDLLDTFEVIKPGASASDVNKALASGRNLLITPGMYTLEQPLRITRPGTIVMGIGWATLTPGENNREGAIVIDDVDNVAVASLLFDAHYSSDTLLKVGNEKNDVDHSASPILLSDLFFRIGGFRPDKVHVDRAVEINSNDVVGDHFWIWRADHGVRGSVGWDVNTAPNGLVVNGDDVTVYGLFNEHFQEYQSLWNGENGRMYFYQCETPYDSPTQAHYMSENGTRPGYAAYKVADGVKNHYAAALGIYDVLVNEIKIENSIEVPDADGVEVFHACNNSLSNGGKRGFGYVINGTGKSTYDTFRDNRVIVNDYRGGK